MKRVEIAHGVIAGVALTLVAGCAEPAGQPPPPRPIAWTQVERHSGSQLRKLPGLVRAAQRAPLSFEVGGRVVKVNVEIGERFEADAVLAKLDTRNFRLNLAERRASLADARARLVESRKTLARKRELQARGVGSEAAVDNAQAAFDSAQAQVNRLQALVNLAQENLVDATLTAPYAGEVLQRAVEPSQQVRAGQTVLEVQGRDGGLEAIINVPETVVDRLRRGATVPVTFPARPRVNLSGEVTEIGAGATTRNAFPVTLALRDTPTSIRPGMTAEVTLSLSDDDEFTGQTLLSIPATAFLAGPDQTTVAFVFDAESSTVRQRPIKLARVDERQALVSAGLEAGEIIASKGLAFLKDGQPVRRLGVGVTRFQQ